MTSSNSISCAKEVQTTYGKGIYIPLVGSSSASDQVFQAVVPNADYRAQVLHHAFVHNVEHVVVVVATSDRCGVAQILYYAVVQFQKRLIEAYQHCLKSIQLFAFQWIGKDCTELPTEYSTLVDKTYASDMESFM